MNILGISISEENRAETLSQIDNFLSDTQPHYIATLNPEIILKSQNNEEYFFILNRADLRIVDSFGLKLACLLSGKNIDRLTGADLTLHILDLAQKRKLEVLIINRNDGLSLKIDIENAIKAKYPKLKFKVAEVDASVKSINSRSACIVLVALGAPDQEKLIYHSMHDTVRQKSQSLLWVGIGGSMDYITKKAIRAPKIMRVIGMEWLWRLMLYPRRFKRIFNATVVFPYKFFVWRFILPFFYRPNVACLLYKKEKGKYKILLAERRDEKNHWQIIQGGTDGESLQKAGARELSEELGCSKFRHVASFKNLYKYKFDKQMRCRHGGYKGQKQSLYIAEFLGKDNEITINFWDHANWKWVDADKFVAETHEKRRTAAEVYFGKFKERVLWKT